MPMLLLRRVVGAIGGLFFKRRLDRDLDDELRAYLDAAIDERMRTGMSHEDATRAARAEIGSLEAVKERTRDAGWESAVETVWQDVRYGVRGLRRHPGFAAVTVLVLAIGIGANTAMFSVVHAVLLEPLGYPDPDRLVSIAREEGGWISLRQLELIASSAQSFAGLGAVRTGAIRSAGDQVALSGKGEPEVLKAARVSAGFLDVLGVQPHLGRGFLAEEDAPGAPAVAMISAELWRRRFGTDPQIAGKTVQLDSTPHTIVGVLPEGFRFPSSGIEVWRPQPELLSIIPAQYHRCCTPLAAFARLRPGVSMDAVRAELAVLSGRYAAANPGAERLDAGPLTVRPWKDRLTAPVSPMLWMLLTAVAFVLLIGCANVATLLLARATSRSREFALRAALGARRSRLLRQLLTESLLLAIAGGLLGLLLAYVALGVVARMTLVVLPRMDEIHLSGAVLAFTAALSLGTGLVFGMLPGWQTLRPNIVATLRHTGAAAGAPKARALGVSARGALVIVQVALSMVLLVGAGLMIKTLVRLAGVDLGFQPASLVTMRLPLAESRYDTPTKRVAFFEELVRRVESLPGVDGVAILRTPPTTGGLGTNLQVEGQEIDEPGHVGMMLQTATPGAFQVLRIPLRSGRDFTARDNVSGAPPVAIVNETFARRVWPAYPNGLSPIGQRLKVPLIETGPFAIVGVVADVRQGGPGGDAQAQFYIPQVLYPPQAAYLVVSGGAQGLRLVPAIRAEVRAIDRDQPLADIRMMDDMLEASIGRQHVVTRLLGGFAASAFLLAALGLYGLVTYSLAQRTQEIGIRRAFGARNGDILTIVLSGPVRLTAAGLVLGVLGALAFTRLLRSLLFEISTTDPQTFIAVPVLFIAIALGACLLPAWRATRIDPMTALRSE